MKSENRPDQQSGQKWEEMHGPLKNSDRNKDESLNQKTSTSQDMDDFEDDDQGEDYLDIGGGATTGGQPGGV
jgi:hypothetical protein